MATAETTQEQSKVAEPVDARIEALETEIAKLRKTTFASWVVFAGLILLL